MTPETQRKYLYQAYQQAQGSPDPSTQCAALLIDPITMRSIASGINEFPGGVKYTDERWERPLKYSVIEHAERNAIYQAARYGNSTIGCIMVAPWAACADCARAIIQAGISTLVRHKQASDRSPQFWLDSIVIADDMLREAGVIVVDYDGDVCAHKEEIKVLHTGQTWIP